MISREDKEYYLEISTNLHGKALFVAGCATSTNSESSKCPNTRNSRSRNKRNIYSRFCIRSVGKLGYCYITRRLIISASRFTFIGRRAKKGYEYHIYCVEGILEPDIVLTFFLIFLLFFRGAFLPKLILHLVNRRQTH